MRRQAAVVLDTAQQVERVQEETPAGLSETAYAMTPPAAAYSAEVATSATKAGSYGVFGEGE